MEQHNQMQMQASILSNSCCMAGPAAASTHCCSSLTAPPAPACSGGGGSGTAGGGGSSPGVQRGMPSSRGGAPLGTAAAQMVVAVRGGRRAGRDHQHAREGGCPSPSYYPHNATAAALTLLTLKSVEMGCRGRGTGGASVAGQNTRGHGKGGHAQAATGYRRPPRRP